MQLNATPALLKLHPRRVLVAVVASRSLEREEGRRGLVEGCMSQAPSPPGLEERKEKEDLQVPPRLCRREWEGEGKGER